jgi:DNA-binding winged helix-turn-helix (wHTH) protein
MIFAFDAFELDAQRLELRHAGGVIKADPLVLRLLEALVDRAGELVTKQELLTRVWGGRAVSDNVLTVTMVRLRRTLKRDASDVELITNVFGRGYRFLRPVTRRDGKLEPIVPAEPAAVRGMPLVGRERAMTAMRAVLAEAVAGRGHAFIVSGEAGIGKTRIVDELTRDAAASGLPVSWAYCRELGATPPLWPFAQLVRAALAKSGLDLRDDRVRAPLRELSRLIPELDSTHSAADERPLVGPQINLAAKHRLFDAVTQLLLMAAGMRASVLVLDDVHQADAATLELLRYLVDELGHTRLLVLATLRSPIGGASVANTAPALLRQLLAHRNCSSATLERLSERDVSEYVQATLGARATALSHAVFVKSEGNPFLMHELLRQVSDDAGSSDQLVFSEAALELARQRLHALHAATRDVLACAAVIGRSFELPLLQAVTGLEMAALMTNLEAAWASEVLVAAPDSRTAFVFDHDLLRDALYEGLVPTERRRLHRAVAEALEQRSAAGEAISSYTLAYHFHAALPESDLRACVRHCAAAAVDAGRSYAYVDGARYFAQAREALDLLQDGSPRMRVKLMFGQALFARAFSSGDYERLTHEVIRVARAQGDAVTLARAVLLFDPHPGFAPMAGSREALEDALAVLPDEHRSLRAALLARRAASAPDAYDVERSDALLTQAFTLIGSHASTAKHYAPLSARLYLRGGPAHRADALSCMEAIESLCQQHPSVLTLAPVLMELHRAIVAQQSGDLLAQDTALASCERQVRALGSRELLWHCERFRAYALINAGETGRGAVVLRELHRRAEQDALLGTSLLCAYDRATVLGAVTDDATKQALSPDAADSPSIWSLKVRALAASGSLRDAHIALTRWPAAQLPRLPCDRDYLGTLGSLAHAAISVGARDYATVLYTLLEPHDTLFSTHITFACQGSVAQLRGMLARSLGQNEAAIAHLETGLQRCEQAGLKTCAEQARQQLAALRQA